MMIQGIGKYYGHYTPEELFIACEMNHYGQFDQRIDHFGKFTIDYLASCVHQFNESKKKAVLKEKTIATPAPKTEDFYRERKQIHDLHRDKAYWDVMVNFVKEQGYIPLYWDWDKVYHYLFESGQLTEYTPEKMQAIYDKTRASVKSGVAREKMGTATIGQLLSAERSGEDTRIKGECRKFVVCEVLNSRFSNYICKQ